MVVSDAPAQYDVVGIGNAIVDVLSHSDHGFLETHGLPKGGMTLIDSETADRVYGAMGPAVEVSGGSVANTMAALAMLGSRAAYIGKVRDDDFGRVFAHDIRAAGVAFDSTPATVGPPTARCHVLVTADAERTMATHLGACLDLGPEDIDPALIAASRVSYLEGYIWDPPRAKEALRMAIRVAKENSRTVALSLSDPFCVGRHREEWRDLVEGPIDIVFANEDEMRALYEEDDLERAVARVRGRCPLAVVTRSEKGSLVVTADEVHEVPAQAVDRLIDTTGAGDMFAAGFLFGLTEGMPLADCARAGAAAAAEVISHFGARPETDLRPLVASATTKETRR
jgi:sugar/nucleoside kinase (ribokinase family)